MKQSYVSLCLIIALAGCGGGGGSSGTTEGSTSSETPSAGNNNSGGTSTPLATTEWARPGPVTNTPGGADESHESSGHTAATTSTTSITSTTSTTSTTSAVDSTTTTTLAGAQSYTVTDTGYLGTFGLLGGGIAALNASGTVGVHTKARNPYGTETYLYLNGAALNVPSPDYATRLFALTPGNKALIYSYTPCRYCTEPVNPGMHIFKDGQLNTLAAPNFFGSVMNEAEQVAGYIKDGEKSSLALYSNGTLTPLGSMLDKMNATAINARGQIAGSAWIATDPDIRRGFLYSEGKLMDLGTYSDAYKASHVSGMNESGQVIGVMQPTDSSRTREAFLYANGNMTMLGTYSDQYNGSYAVAINDAGHVVGSLEPKDTSQPVQAFLYADGKMTLLGAFHPSGINNRGEIIGYQGDRCVIYRDGQLTYVDEIPEVKASGWKIKYGAMMNDRGQIAITGETSDQRLHALLISPVN